MIALLLTKQISELFIIMFFGYAMVKSRILKTEDSKVLSVITLYLIIPCVIINAFQIEYSAAVRDGLILAFAAAFVVHILFIVITKVLGKIFSFNSVERASIIYVTQMAQIYGKDAEYASAIYFLTTALCIVTMPLIVWLYQV